jgi:Protein kinase domain/FHA domain
MIPLLPRAPRAPISHVTTVAKDGTEQPPPPLLPNATMDACEIHDTIVLVSAGDVFNEYTIGRSKAKCDICVSPEIDATTSATATSSGKKRRANLDWCYSLISNQHCKLYCTLDETVGMPVQNRNRHDDETALNRHTGWDIVTLAKRGALQVWIEDCSINGTVINGSTVLHAGDKRLLHAGDEICLVHPLTVRRKIGAASSAQVSHIVQQFSYVFVNGVVNGLPPRPVAPPTTSRISTNDNNSHSSTLTPTLSFLATVTQRAAQRDATAARTAAVNARVAAADRPLARPCREDSASPETMRGGDVTSSLGPADSRRRISPRRQPPRQIQHDYDMRDVLGRGTMGEVRRAIHRQTGQPVAVKILSLVRQRGPWNQCTEIEREATILRQLQHPYVVKLLDVYTAPEAIYLVMELVAGGDLFDRIVQRGAYSEINARRVLRRLLAAVHYLHEASGLHIVHRDLKPENILLTTTTSDIDVKLTDFGLAKPDGDLKTFCGTPQYFAPVRRRTLMGLRTSNLSCLNAILLRSHFHRKCSDVDIQSRVPVATVNRPTCGPLELSCMSCSLACRHLMPILVHIV